jgi:hypothetical protein
MQKIHNGAQKTVTVKEIYVPSEGRFGPPDPSSPEVEGAVSD